jgi:hypothetical protein
VARLVEARGVVVLTRLLAFCILLCAAASLLEAGPKRIAIVSIHQSRSLEPAAISVFVTVPPAPENRGYFVIAEPQGRGVSQSSFRQLEGEVSEGPLRPVDMKLTGGVYAVGAVLVGERGRVLARSDLRTVRVQCRICADDEDAND